MVFSDGGHEVRAGVDLVFGFVIGFGFGFGFVLDPFRWWAWIDTAVGSCRLEIGQGGNLSLLARVGLLDLDGSSCHVSGDDWAADDALLGGWHHRRRCCVFWSARVLGRIVAGLVDVDVDDGSLG